jgi:hypothetical protein
MILNKKSLGKKNGERLWSLKMFVFILGNEDEKGIFWTTKIDGVKLIIKLFDIFFIILYFRLLNSTDHQIRCRNILLALKSEPFTYTIQN